MKVICLKSHPTQYSGNSYLLLGTWNTLDDVNTVIDTGSDDFIIKEIETINTGVGKVPVNKVILTHNHFDHMGGAVHLKKKYHCTVCANIFSGDLVDVTLRDNEDIRLADKYFTVIHSPAHSSDSLCLYCKEDRVLFSGDTPLQIMDATGSYTDEFVDTLQRLTRLDISVIYPGHGPPVRERPGEMIQLSLNTVLKCRGM
jgi:glyoxylase-like metal-dependent hydrolase (beta-lactamase superfamily II)